MSKRNWSREKRRRRPHPKEKRVKDWFSGIVQCLWNIFKASIQTGTNMHNLKMLIALTTHSHTFSPFSSHEKATQTSFNGLFLFSFDFDTIDVRSLSSHCIFRQNHFSLASFFVSHWCKCRVNASLVCHKNSNQFCIHDAIR